MSPVAPQLPTRFPCWCRAIYSWGGETKRDLGFVEGDLIECLNAGDGQWWMGRLRRDRRMVGLFPSNFVEVLGEDFVPVTRATSPMMPAGRSPITNPTSAPKKQKTVFRKPFQAHKEALAPAELARNATTTTQASSSIPQTPPRNGSSVRSVKPLRTPTTAVKNQSSLSRPPSQHRPSSGGGSPHAPPVADPPPQSPTPARESISRSRPPSRAPSPRLPYDMDLLPPSVPVRHTPLARPPSVHPPSHEISPLQLQEREESPPPPPPPPHRIAVNRRPSMDMDVPMHLDMNDRYATMSRTPSPAAHSDANGNTP